jgi:hypothetical protein
VKDELDRIYLSGHLEDTATELNRKLVRARDSGRKRSAYGVSVFAICCLAFVGALYLPLSFPLPVPFFIFIIPLLVGALLRNHFVKKYAGYAIWDNERLFLRLWNAVGALQQYVDSDGTDEGSFSDAYAFLDVSGYASFAATSWGFLYEIKTQIRRVLRNIMRRIRPHIMSDKRNVRQIEQLVIPMLKRLLPLLINSDYYSLESWNNAVEDQWRELVTPPFVTRDRARSLISRLWVRVLACFAIAAGAVVLGSVIEAVDFLTYVKAEYWSLLEFLALIIGLVLAHAALSKRS